MQTQMGRILSACCSSASLLPGSSCPPRRHARQRAPVPLQAASPAGGLATQGGMQQQLAAAGAQAAGTVQAAWVPACA